MEVILLLFVGVLLVVEVDMYIVLIYSLLNKECCNFILIIFFKLKIEWLNENIKRLLK